MLFRATGEFREQLRRYPDSPRARLERWTVLQIEPTLAASLLDRLRSDPFVEAARDLGPPMAMGPIPRAVSATAQQPSGTEAPHGAKSIGVQDHRAALNVDTAWNALGVEGWAWVTVIDSGIDTGHPDLKSTNPGAPPTFAGGNFIDAASFDFAESDYNVDEREAKRVAPPADPNFTCAEFVTDPVACAPDASCWVYRSAYVGHGTHVSGTIGAKWNPAQDPVAGVCKHCSVQMHKIAAQVCQDGSFPYFVYPEISQAALLQAIGVGSELGAQVVNFSFNYNPFVLDPNLCNSGGASAVCDALANARYNDVLVAGSSGNQRDAIRQPASTNSVLAVGGRNQAGGFWDDLVAFGYCPMGADECGSNWTINGISPKQAAAVQARNVLSTVYRGFDWNPWLRCGDAVFNASFPPPAAPNMLGVPGDGFGHCTGTSMSTPQLAGVAGLLRSANPLLRIGDPFNAFSPPGVRSAIRDASSLASWTPELGFGTPNAADAARIVLGKVRKKASVLNRVTPLFTMYSDDMTDYASTPSPQSAMALYRFTSPYAPHGGSPTVPLYGAFPSAVPLLPTMFPRANMHVLTTSIRPNASYPPLVPLYWLDKQTTSTPGCRPGFDKGCAVVDRDFMTVSSVAHLDAALAAGYRYFGRQGYIYQVCEGLGCAPPGTEPVHRRCNSGKSDCAIFLASEDASYLAAGYTDVFPPGSSVVIGHAYPPVDTDGDELIDGMERVIGTSHLHADSDGDGLFDSEEYPLTGISTSLACDPTPNFCP